MRLLPAYALLVAACGSSPSTEHDVDAAVSSDVPMEHEAWSLVPAVNSAVAVAIAPNTRATPYMIYVGTTSGVMHSPDGTTWFGSTSPAVLSVASMPQVNVAFASITDGTVIVTKDSGATWTPTSASPGSTLSAWVAIAGVGPLGAGSSAGHGVVYMGKQQGSTWTPSTTFGTGVATSIAAATMTTAYVGVNGTGGGVFKSTNIGTVPFTFESTNFPQTQVLSVATVSSTIFAGTNGQGAGIYVSRDAGTTWSASGTGLGNLVVNTIAADPTSAQNIYAGTADGLYKSKDGGATWTLSGIAGSSVTSLAVLNGSTSTVYAVAGSQLYVTRTGGE